jgi:hypothetical protein
VLRKAIPSLWDFIIIFIFTLVLLLSVRGRLGTPLNEQLNDPQWSVNGPIELSPERGRYALTYSLVENRSVFFSLPIARFATPDLGYKNEQFVSLFPPGVSFITIPGYLLGKLFGASQVGTYLTITFFALINAILIIKLARWLGAGQVTSILGAIIFLFASPAYAYSVSLFQHHVSTFLILACLHLLGRYKSNWILLAVFFIMAAAIPIDYPNLFLLLPVGFYALSRMFSFKNKRKKLLISIKPLAFLTVAGILLPLIFFMWFNKQSYGHPMQFSGTVEAIKEIDAQGNPVHHEKVSEKSTVVKISNPHEQEKKTAISFFRTRNLLHGFYIHLLSYDRGVLIYTPIMFLAVFGCLVLYKRHQTLSLVFLAIISINILLYSMWGDPYGGWAFGSRYLIPSYALASILMALALEKWYSKKWFLLIFFVLAFYSIAVNTLGALTSNRIPPQAEVLYLESLSNQEEKYTYERDFDLLKSNQSKSFVFQTYLKPYMKAEDYYYLVITPIILMLVTGTILLAFTNKSKLNKFKNRWHDYWQDGFSNGVKKIPSKIVSFFKKKIKKKPNIKKIIRKILPKSTHQKIRRRLHSELVGRKK